MERVGVVEIDMFLNLYAWIHTWVQLASSQANDIVPFDVKARTMSEILSNRNLINYIDSL
jgi:hypothetical protein